MEELLMLLREQMEFGSPDDGLHRLILAVLEDRDETLLQEEELEDIRAAAGVPQIPDSLKPAHGDTRKK